jgi:hypothetical protein
LLRKETAPSLYRAHIPSVLVLEIRLRLAPNPGILDIMNALPKVPHQSSNPQIIIKS